MEQVGVPRSLATRFRAGHWVRYLGIHHCIEPRDRDISNNDRCNITEYDSGGSSTAYAALRREHEEQQICHNCLSGGLAPFVISLVYERFGSESVNPLGTLSRKSRRRSPGYPFSIYHHFSRQLQKCKATLISRKLINRLAGSGSTTPAI